VNPPTFGGLDIGSRTVKLVLLRAGAVVAEEVRYHAHDPLAVCRELLAGRAPEVLVATGYGRRLCEGEWGCRTVTEIRAVAAGARHREPACRTIIDIGGQDTKAIALEADGRTRKFEMNDKCAAGTGRFLEVMAMALGLSLADFAAAALGAASTAQVNDMCTVFAESEVVSLIAKGIPRDALARGLHLSVARKAAALARRVGAEGPLLLCGGVGHNACVRAQLEELLGPAPIVPAGPQTVAALGAALIARDPAQM